MVAGYGPGEPDSAPVMACGGAADVLEPAEAALDAVAASLGDEVVWDGIPQPLDSDSKDYPFGKLGDDGCAQGIASLTGDAVRRSDRPTAPTRPWTLIVGPRRARPGP